MAKIKGSLEAANTALVLTPLADEPHKTGAERWLIPREHMSTLRCPTGSTTSSPSAASSISSSARSSARSLPMIWSARAPAAEVPRDPVRSSNSGSAIRFRRALRPVH